MTVKVVTDSACDLPQELADELGITIVPLTVRFGEEEFVDRKDLTAAEFWARCDASPTIPLHTAALRLFVVFVVGRMESKTPVRRQH